MELSPSEAANRSATQEFTNILWSPEVQYRVHKGPPMVHILNQMNQVRTTPSWQVKVTLRLMISQSVCLSFLMTRY
jgi:hypothetical protein